MPAVLTSANAPGCSEIDSRCLTCHLKPMSHLISDSELEVALSGLPGWSVENNQLCKRFVLPSFRDAVAAIVRISFEAEESNHHPVISCFYTELEIRLTTGDAGDKLTDKDLKLAAKIEELVG